MSSVKVVSTDSDGVEFVCFIKKPTPAINSQAKIHSNIFASTLLNTKDVNGRPSVLLRSMADQHLKNLGIWTDSDEQKVKDIYKSISERERLLAAGGSKGITKSKAKTICKEIITLRDDLTEIISKRRELDRLTLESQVEQANFDFLISMCVLDEEGVRLFSSVEDYQEKVGQPWVYAAASKLSEIVFGSNEEDPRKDLVEYKTLIKLGFMNDTYEWVNSDGHRIDEVSGRLVSPEGRYINEDGSFCDVYGQPLTAEGEPLEQFEEFLDD